MKYSIDSCTLIVARRDIFPVDIVPAFWDKLNEAITAGDIRATELVADELEAKEGDEDELYRWTQDQQGLYVPIDEPIQKEVKSILKRHPGLVNIKKNKSGADPFVVALARINGCAVVTQEVKSGPGGAPKIPNVCADLDVECINLLTLCRRQEWKFTK
jgi:hypothetical protein